MAEQKPATVGVELPEKPKKAYYVQERWTSFSSLIVFADTAEKAKQAVRNGDEENIIVLDLITRSSPGGITARRAPREDRR